MTHLKDNCRRDDLIIADRCGLACANCGACKCGHCNEDKEKIKVKIACLEREKRLLSEGWDVLKNQYSTPHFQLEEIDKEINKLKSQL